MDPYRTTEQPKTEKNENGCDWRAQVEADEDDDVSETPSDNVGNTFGFNINPCTSERLVRAPDA